MLRWFNKKLRNRKGFSLVELIIVVGILGILAAVAVPRVTTSLATAKTNTDKANLRTLNQAVEMYYLDNGAYPSEVIADFRTEIAKYIGTLPKVQDTTYYFIYDKDVTGDKVVYTTTAAVTGTNIALTPAP